MPLWDLFWAMVWFFLFVAWIWLIISVFGDIFRSADLGGGAKAFWSLFVIVIPWLGVLIYLIARGNGMADRTARAAAAQAEAGREYIRQVAGSESAADELKKLSDLKASGVITEAEFTAQKAKLLV